MVPGKLKIRVIFFFQEPVADSFIVQVWYSQQVEEGNALGYPLGYGPYGSTRPVKVVATDDDGDEDDDSSSDGGLPGTVDEDGKGVPLYGRESKIILDDKCI